jgi:hypothetical protein
MAARLRPNQASSKYDLKTAGLRTDYNAAAVTRKRRY